MKRHGRYATDSVACVAMRDVHISTPAVLNPSDVVDGSLPFYFFFFFYLYSTHDVAENVE
jgi:hypothetical protein